jgi:hypothetical protein
MYYKPKLISLVKQGEFKVVLGPADRLHKSFTTNFFELIKVGSLAMSAGKKHHEFLNDFIVLPS